MVVYIGSTDNLVSTEVVEKLNFKRQNHPTPYKVSWLQKGHQILVNEQYEIELQIRSYKDKILNDVIPIEVCHSLLGRPWKFDRSVAHDGKKNNYKFQKDGINHTMLPLQEGGNFETSDPKSLLMSRK